MTGLGLVAVVLVTAGTWHMWRGGFNPPARFLVPIVPVLALGVAAALTRGHLRAGGAPRRAGGCGWAPWAWPSRGCSTATATAPHRSFAPSRGPRSGRGCLPGFVLEDAQRRRLATVWVLALGAAIVWRGRGSTRGLAVASLGLLAAAGAASRFSHGANRRTRCRSAWWVGRRSWSPACDRSRPRAAAGDRRRSRLGPGLRAASVSRRGPPWPNGCAWRRARYELEVRAEILDDGPPPPELVFEGGGHRRDAPSRALRRAISSGSRWEPRHAT